MNERTLNAAPLNNQRGKTLHMVQMALLAAVSIALVLLLRVPMFLPFLEYDMADVPVLLGAFAMGPGAGLTVLLIVSVIQAFLLGGNGWIGLIMHFVATGTMVLVASAIYRACAGRNWGLLLGLAAGTVARAAVMLPMNFIFIPKLSFDVPLLQSTAMLGEQLLGLHTGVAFGEMAATAYGVVQSVLLTAIIPFNLVVGAINSVVFFIIFKSLRFFLDKRQQG